MSFYDISYFVIQYRQTETLAIGAYDFTVANDTMRPVEFFKIHYKEGMIWAFNETYIFDSTLITGMKLS